jgi:hypothetical protein
MHCHPNTKRFIPLWHALVLFPELLRRLLLIHSSEGKFQEGFSKSYSPSNRHKNSCIQQYGPYYKPYIVQQGLNWINWQSSIIMRDTSGVTQVSMIVRDKDPKGVMSDLHGLEVCASHLKGLATQCRNCRSHFRVPHVLHLPSKSNREQASQLTFHTRDTQLCKYNLQVHYLLSNWCVSLCEL